MKKNGPYSFVILLTLVVWAGSSPFAIACDFSFLTPAAFANGLAGDSAKIIEGYSRIIDQLLLSGFSHESLQKMASQKNYFKLSDGLLQESSSDLQTLRETYQQYLSVVQKLAIEKNVSEEEFVKVLHEKQTTQEGRGEGRKEEVKKVARIQTPYNTISFVKMKPGKWHWAEAEIPETEIKKPFQYMKTHVTQEVFEKVMGFNPSYFKNKSHPVESMTEKERRDFLAKIKRWARNDDPRIKEIIPDHQKGDDYDFPTEAQDHWVRLNATTEDGKTIEELVKEENWQKLREYAVFWDNSNNSTQPVGSKKPLLIDGQEIDDLHGNVYSVMRDAWNDKPFGGVGPVRFAKKGSGRVVRGGSWDHVARSLRSAFRSLERPDSRSVNVGLRLVRTRAPQREVSP